MKNMISHRAANITPSVTLAITAKAKKMKADGISVIGFGAGEPDFGTPDFIVEAAKKALDENFTKYTPSSGMPALRQAIADKLRRENGLSYEPSQIIVSNGAKHSLFNAMAATVDPGAEVIIASPYWLTYPELVRLCDGVPVFVRTEEELGFKLSPAALEAAITPKTKWLILNSPSNPTGAVYSREELSALAEVCIRRDIGVISDEIYEKLVYAGAEHVSIASLPGMAERTVVVNGLSKSCAMTGWRIGYLAAPKEIAKAVDGLQSHATSNANSIAQAASVAAITNPEEDRFLHRMVEAYDARRKFMLQAVSAIPGLSCHEPKGAFYLFVNVSGILGRTCRGKVLKDAVDVADQMLESGVAVVPGNAFGAPDHIRLSYALSMEDIREGMKRIAAFAALL